MRMRSKYGFCPICGRSGIARERRPNGNDTCRRGHSYPSSTALAKRPPAKQRAKDLSGPHFTVNGTTTFGAPIDGAVPFVEREKLPDGRTRVVIGHLYGAKVRP